MLRTTLIWIQKKSLCGHWDVRNSTRETKEYLNCQSFAINLLFQAKLLWKLDRQRKSFYTHPNQGMFGGWLTSSASLVMGYFSRLEITSRTATMLWICNREDKVTPCFVYSYLSYRMSFKTFPFVIAGSVNHKIAVTLSGFRELIVRGTGTRTV